MAPKGELSAESRRAYDLYSAIQLDTADQGENIFETTSKPTEEEDDEGLEEGLSDSAPHERKSFSGQQRCGSYSRSSGSYEVLTEMTEAFRRSNEIALEQTEILREHLELERKKIASLKRKMSYENKVLAECEASVKQGTILVESSAQIKRALDLQDDDLVNELGRTHNYLLKKFKKMVDEGSSEAADDSDAL